MPLYFFCSNKLLSFWVVFQHISSSALASWIIGHTFVVHEKRVKGFILVTILTELDTLSFLQNNQGLFLNWKSSKTLYNNALSATILNFSRNASVSLAKPCVVSSRGGLDNHNCGIKVFIGKHSIYTPGPNGATPAQNESICCRKVKEHCTTQMQTKITAAGLKI